MSLIADRTVDTYNAHREQADRLDALAVRLDDEADTLPASAGRAKAALRDAAAACVRDSEHLHMLADALAYDMLGRQG